MAGMMRAAATMTEVRYAREMRTLGVAVMTAATRKEKLVRMVDGRVDMACMRVLYDAIMMGGRGGRAC
jgi:hypothetical protein